MYELTLNEIENVSGGLSSPPVLTPPFITVSILVIGAAYAAGVAVGEAIGHAVNDSK